MKRSSYILVLLLVLGVFALFVPGCKKNTTYKWVNYDETFCADGWEFTANNETLKNNITEHFNKKDIKIYDIEIFTDRDPEQFLICSNKTGRRLHCKVKLKNLDDMKAMGFYE